MLTLALYSLLISFSFIELHNKTIMPLAAFIITIGGWFLWNIILNYTYNLKEQLAYGMRWGFVSDFGPMPEWWLTVIACVMVFFVFEICVIGLRKMFLPSDTDVFQELEKDDQLRRKFEETCKDVLQYTEAARESFESEQCSEEERKREEEVRELLEVRQRNLAEEELKKQNEFLRPGSGRRKSIPFSGRMSLERKRSGGLARPRPSLERRMSSDKRRVSMGVRRKSDFDMAVPEHEESKDGPSQ